MILGDEKIQARHDSGVALNLQQRRQNLPLLAIAHPLSTTAFISLASARYDLPSSSRTSKLTTRWNRDALRASTRRTALSATLPSAPVRCTSSQHERAPLQCEMLGTVTRRMAHARPARTVRVLGGHG